MPWYEQLVINLAVAIFSAGIWQAIMQRRWQRQDRNETGERETSAAQIVDRQKMVNELWEHVEKLQQAERELAQAQLKSERELMASQMRVLQLEQELKNERRFSIEQHEEIVKLGADKAVIEVQLNNLKRAQLLSPRFEGE